MAEMHAWLEAALDRAREVRRENARRGVSSYSGGVDDGWVEALEKVQSVLNVEGNRNMPNIFELFKIAGEVMRDLPTLEAAALALSQGKMPSPQEIALLMKLIADVKAAV